MDAGEPLDVGELLDDARGGVGLAVNALDAMRGILCEEVDGSMGDMLQVLTSGIVAELERAEAAIERILGERGEE